MSKNDIGWIDKNEVSDAVRALKDRQRKRRRRGPSQQSETNEDGTYVDLLGETKASPFATPTAPEESGFIERPATQEPAPATPRATPPPAQPAARTTTPTEKIISSPQILDEVDDAGPAIPGSRPAQDSTRDRQHTAPVQQRVTATLETTPTSAEEPEQDLDLRFKDALDVLRSADPSHPQERQPKEPQPPTQIPASTLHDAPDELRLTDTIETERVEAPAEDLQLGADTAQTPTQPTSDDHALELQAPPIEPQTPDALHDDQDALSLPAHDLDLSLRASNSLPTQEDQSDTRDLSDDLVFESDDFQDEDDTQGDISLPEVDVDTDDPVETADPSLDLSASALEDLLPQPNEGKEPTVPGRQTPTTPEHAYVPKIHSQILRTVRLKNAPNPEDSASLHAWFKALHTWITNAEASATQFFVADQAGLPLLDTDVPENTVAVAVATRQSMSDLQTQNVQTGSGYTVFRHNEDRYMNLIWAPSQHGIITLGMISDHVYPDERLASFEGKLLRAIDRLPFT